MAVDEASLEGRASWQLAGRPVGPSVNRDSKFVFFGCTLRIDLVLAIVEK